MRLTDQTAATNPAKSGQNSSRMPNLPEPEPKSGTSLMSNGSYNKVNNRLKSNIKVNNLRLLTPVLSNQVKEVQQKESTAHHNHPQQLAVSDPDPHYTTRLLHLCDVSCPHASLLTYHCHHGDVLWTVNEIDRVICVSDACADAPCLCPCVSSMNPSLVWNLNNYYQLLFTILSSAN